MLLDHPTTSGHHLGESLDGGIHIGRRAMQLANSHIQSWEHLPVTEVELRFRILCIGATG
jgi:hypothetical protein